MHYLTAFVDWLTHVVPVVVVSLAVFAIVMVLLGWCSRKLTHDAKDSSDEEIHNVLAFPDRSLDLRAARSRSGAAPRSDAHLSRVYELQLREQRMGRPDNWLVSNGDYLSAEQRLLNHPQDVA